MSREFKLLVTFVKVNMIAMYVCIYYVYVMYLWGICTYIHTYVSLYIYDVHIRCTYDSRIIKFI